MSPFHWVDPPKLTEKEKRKIKYQEIKERVKSGIITMALVMSIAITAAGLIAVMAGHNPLPDEVADAILDMLGSLSE